MCYPNKDAILVELMTAHVRAGVEITRRQLAGGLPESLEDGLRVFVRSTMDNHRDRPRLHQVMFEEAPRPAEFLRLIHESEQAIVAAAAGLLAGHPQVRVADPVVAARMVVATIESLVHRLVATEDAVDPSTFEDQLVLMLTRYLEAG